MIILDGKKLSKKIFSEIAAEIISFKNKLRLGVVVVEKNAVIEKFIAEKKKVAQSLGIDIRIYSFRKEITTNELRKKLRDIVHERKNNGVVIQLPMPSHVNTQYILNAVPPLKDVDVLSAHACGNFAVGKNPVFPPVVGAVKRFFEEYEIQFKDAHIAVLGGGSLVGRPIALWLMSEKATFTMLRSNTKKPEVFIHHADIIISGTGKPGSITAPMVKNGVIVIDAGTSESEGKLSGDVDFNGVSEKSAYITPVPGGIGPVTVALLFQNLVTLAKLQR